MIVGHMDDGIWLNCQHRGCEQKLTRVGDFPTVDELIDVAVRHGVEFHGQRMSTRV